MLIVCCQFSFHQSLQHHSSATTAEAVMTLGSVQLQIVADEHSQYGGNVVDCCEVKRCLVVIRRMPDIRERVADQMHHRHSCSPATSRITVSLTSCTNMSTVVIVPLGLRLSTKVSSKCSRNTTKRLMNTVQKRPAVF